MSKIDNEAVTIFVHRGAPIQHARFFFIVFQYDDIASDSSDEDADDEYLFSDL